MQVDVDKAKHDRMVRDILMMFNEPAPSNDHPEYNES